MVEVGQATEGGTVEVEARDSLVNPCEDECLPSDHRAVSWGVLGQVSPKEPWESRKIEPHE